MEFIPCIIIGGGVVGLAIAKQLSEALEVCVLEQEKQIASQTSARNSGVIHAGIYYPDHFLKSSLCIQGKRLLYAYCLERDIAYKRLGKILIATSEDEIPQLELIRKNAQAKGIPLDYLDQQELKEREPELHCSKALYSPSSGIIDVHQLCQQLAADILHNGSFITVQQAVTHIEQHDDGFTIEINHREKVRCQYLINAAGLAVQDVAAMAGSRNIPKQYLCKGQYFSYQAPSPFSHLIYPLPMQNNQGLGIHVTLDLAGQCRFGPDANYIDHIDYQNDEHNKAAFIQAIQRYYPTLDAQKLQADFSGIRPKLSGPDEAMQDFALHGPEQHGINNLVNLYGIESPGLTSSLAIAQFIQQLLRL